MKGGRRCGDRPEQRAAIPREGPWLEIEGRL